MLMLSRRALEWESAAEEEGGARLLSMRSLVPARSATEPRPPFPSDIDKSACRLLWLGGGSWAVVGAAVLPFARLVLTGLVVGALELL